MRYFELTRKREQNFNLIFCLTWWPVVPFIAFRWSQLTHKDERKEVNSTEISDDNRDHDDDGHEPDHGDDVDDDSDDG